MTTSPKPINLALQGGGSHGALTWGVLDRLLEDPRLAIREVSGTSAGAMNAVVLADGFQRAGAEGARAALGRFWKAVSDAARFSPMRRSLWDRLWGRHSLDHSPGYLMFEGLGRIFSPYDLNPLGINPLRDLLLANVDFGRVNACDRIRVHVTATNVRTGRARVFSRGEVTADAVLASACLPQMSPAVEIDGEAYWDGGFSGNPALQPLVESEHPDILLVQINPMIRHAVPRSAREIINRVNEISFNASLLKELRALNLVQRLMAMEGVEPGAKRSAFLHLIHVDDDVQDLAASSKLNAEWDYLELLFDRGRRWADTWLAANFDALGARSTFDLDELFEEPRLRPAGTVRLVEMGEDPALRSGGRSGR
ncbi:patatin-like phospholipase family protein [Amaricoccus solimangrovi]|uniref:Patatin-like phospholipase family protein n=1 Tax=Amaricoccus solimangrovi TaxID=2589815 RepID=A0A501WYK2_9RHOB|nr:patatin-like phospholipase family protein [Amaricoccus solimangrovi]TPE53862.1 patatin-like phospholipase family protein [Amaricoccus solimangrovi]